MNLYKKFEVDLKCFKDSLASMRMKHVKYNSQELIDKKKGWWVGIKVKEIVEEVEEE